MAAPPCLGAKVKQRRSSARPPEHAPVGVLWHCPVRPPDRLLPHPLRSWYTAPMFESLKSLFRRKSEIRRPWFGPLSLAQPEVMERLQSIPTLQALVARGWDPASTLLYVPRIQETFDADVYVLGRMFAWDAQSPVIWVFSTIGLCEIEQPARERRAAFKRFELVLATNNAEKEDPFPSHLGVVLSQAPGTVPGWDWSQVAHPPLVQWLALAAQDFASWMKRDGSHFAITDTLAIGPGKSSWTRSVLNNSVLLPATPHMLALGLVPFNQPGDPRDAVRPGEWHKAPGTDRFTYGFYWLLPVSDSERKRADSEGTWDLFAHLVELAPADAKDDCAVAFDWLRGADQPAKSGS